MPGGSGMGRPFMAIQGASVAKFIDKDHYLLVSTSKSSKSSDAGLALYPSIVYLFLEEEAERRRNSRASDWLEADDVNAT